MLVQVGEVGKLRYGHRLLRHGLANADADDDKRLCASSIAVPAVSMFTCRPHHPIVVLEQLGKLRIVRHGHLQLRHGHANADADNAKQLRVGSIPVPGLHLSIKLLAQMGGLGRLRFGHRRMRHGHANADAGNDKRVCASPIPVPGL